MKKILFLTGTRADFGKIKPLIQVVDYLDNYDYRIFVTGMHMLRRYGSTFKEVEDCGFHHVHKYFNQHIDEPMEMVLANTIHGLSRYVHEVHPDLIVVHGDRVESLAGAIVGSMNNILVAHIEGGERSGTIDELIRHSVTKLSHIHLVANEEAKRRIIQMGESEDTVYVIGSADIDCMKDKDKLPSIEVVKQRYEIPFDHYHIVLFHPVTTEVNRISEFASNLVDALIDSHENFLVIYPNNDHGTNEIIEQYQRLNGNERFKVYPSIRFEYFLTLIHHARTLIGNSSAGIREAPIFGVPSINVGTRQNNRYQGQSIFNTGYSKEEILLKINELKVQNVRHETSDYFGTGNSADAFRELLIARKIWDISPQKIFYDRD